MSTIAEDNSRFPRPVICAWCNNRYRSVVPTDDDSQGDDCASNVYQADARTVERFNERRAERETAVTIDAGQWFVKGHYGSTYDTELWRFIKNAPSAPADPVCDNCIGERIHAGDLERIKGNFL